MSSSLSSRQSRCFFSSLAASHAPFLPLSLPLSFPSLLRTTFDMSPGIVLLPEGTEGAREGAFLLLAAILDQKDISSDQDTPSIYS